MKISPKKTFNSDDGQFDFLFDFDEISLFFFEQIYAHKDKVTCLQFDKTKLITGSKDRTVKVRNFFLKMKTFVEVKNSKRNPKLLKNRTETILFILRCGIFHLEQVKKK